MVLALIAILVVLAVLALVICNSMDVKTPALNRHGPRQVILTKVLVQTLQRKCPPLRGVATLVKRRIQCHTF
jgi:hypothetical protein